MQSIPKSFYHAVDFTRFAQSPGVSIVPTSLCTSPWGKSLQYGGNVACALYSGLAAQLPHQHGGGGGGVTGTPAATHSGQFRLCNFTLYFFKPVPNTPLILAPVAPLRLGSKVMHLQASLRTADDEKGGAEVARAVGVFMREHDVSSDGVYESPCDRKPNLEAVHIGGDGAVPTIGGSHVPGFEQPGVGFFWGIDVKTPRWMFSSKEGETRQYWSRLKIPIFGDTPVDPIHRLLLIGEGSGGLMSFLPLDKYSFVNPVFNMTLLRAPRSDWVSLRGRTDVDPLGGAGVCNTTMFDEVGLVATIAQPQIIEAHDRAWKKK